MDRNDFPSTEQILGMMEEQLGNDGVPPVMRHAARVMPEILAEHVRGKLFAMPPAGGALDDETRTLIYLGAAIAAGSLDCVRAMSTLALRQEIPQGKLLEAFKIARLVVASGAIANAEPLLALLDRVES